MHCELEELRASGRYPDLGSGKDSVLWLCAALSPVLVLPCSSGASTAHTSTQINEIKQ